MDWKLMMDAANYVLDRLGRTRGGWIQIAFKMTGVSENFLSSEQFEDVVIHMDEEEWDNWFESKNENWDELKISFIASGVPSAGSQSSDYSVTFNRKKGTWGWRISDRHHERILPSSLDDDVPEEYGGGKVWQMYDEGSDELKEARDHENFLLGVIEELQDIANDYSNQVYVKIIADFETHGLNFHSIASSNVLLFKNKGNH